MTRSIVFDLLIMAAGIAGFFLAFYIYHCKHKKQPLVCPIHGSCDTVTGSTYGKFLGVPVELLGLGYYAIVVLFHGAMLAYAASSSLVTTFTFGLSACTLFFSIYLVSVQAFVLKHWCTWCLFSAFLCAVIFVLTLVAH